MKEHYIVVEWLCACAKKHKLERVITSNDIFDAEEQAKEIAEKCNEHFCGRHGFDVEMVEEHFVISVEHASYVESCEI